MRVEVIIYTCVVLDVSVANWNAKYYVYQDDDNVTSDIKVLLGSNYITPWFAAIKVNKLTLRNEGLSRNWSLYPNFEEGFMYMVKIYQEDIYLSKPVKYALNMY